ncbi:Endopolyphosphatase [Mortierella sp. AD011]|nr:Endopolyphosphatase [Mortierella sp. AD010]KAF9395091.1 Endopolyphosphatase [Mortierella sp. AD011]
MSGQRHPRILLLGAALVCCLAAATVTSAASQGSSSGLVGRFLHITDIHPDEHYLDGATVSTSCHTILNKTEDAPTNNLRKGRFSFPLKQEQDKSESIDKALTVQDMSIIRPGLMDIGIDENAVGGYYGLPNTICDSPLALADATLSWIDQNLVGSIDFVVWTGDNARHDSDNTHPRTQEQINQMNDAMAKKFLEAFPRGPDGKRIPVVPCIGNNDIYPHNIMYPGPGPVLQHYSQIWSEFIPEDQINTFRRGGYYMSEVVPGKLSVFALNTLYFYIHNVAVDGCHDKDEPGTEQMDWLEEELKQLRKRKMAAYLVGHVPPETKSYTKSCHSRYAKIALEFQDVIVGHLYGHANIDHFFFVPQNMKKKNNLLGEWEEEEEDQAFSVMDEDDHDPFHLLGLSSYLQTLWKQYNSIPKNANPSDYAVIQVSPSVVPTYQPTMRVFTYELANGATSSVDTEDHLPGCKDDMMNCMVDMIEQELEEYITTMLDSDAELAPELQSMYKNGHKKPRTYPPAPVSTFGYPLSYTQYWTNLTLANESLMPPQFEIEYQTREDYGLQHLGVSEYLALARRIAKNKLLRKEYLKRMVVQSENALVQFGDVLA